MQPVVGPFWTAPLKHAATPSHPAVRAFTQRPVNKPSSHKYAKVRSSFATTGHRAILARTVWQVSNEISCTWLYRARPRVIRDIPLIYVACTGRADVIFGERMYTHGMPIFAPYYICACFYPLYLVFYDACLGLYFEGPLWWWWAYTRYSSIVYRASLSAYADVFAKAPLEPSLRYIE